jgi:hypothetical protein
VGSPPLHNSLGIFWWGRSLKIQREIKREIKRHSSAIQPQLKVHPIELMTSFITIVEYATDFNNPKSSFKLIFIHEIAPQ